MVLLDGIFVSRGGFALKSAWGRTGQAAADLRRVSFPAAQIFAAGDNIHATGRKYGVL